MRSTHSTDTPWEKIVGYSRAVRVEERVFVTGTTATRDGKIVGQGDGAAQMRQVLENIRAALEALGASLGDVVRTRIYVTEIARWKEIGEVHGEVFGAIRPATTMVEVSGLIDPDMLVEVEADAIVGSAAGS